MSQFRALERLGSSPLLHPALLSDRQSVPSVFEITVDGATYRCYRTWCVDPEWNGPVDSFIVAGFGTVSVERSSGAVVSTAPVVTNAVPLLEKMAPHLAEQMRRLDDYDRDAAE